MAKVSRCVTCNLQEPEPLFGREFFGMAARKWNAVRPCMLGDA